MKYVAYIEIEADHQPDEDTLRDLILDAIEHKDAKVHVHVECPSKRWSANAPDDY